MKEDTWTRTEADAAHVARDLGRGEAIGGDWDDTANGLLDESRFCRSCEHGHGGHVCGWCGGRVA